MIYIDIFRIHVELASTFFSFYQGMQQTKITLTLCDHIRLNQCVWAQLVIRVSFQQSVFTWKGSELADEHLDAQVDLQHASHRWRARIRVISGYHMMH